jgi:hypothetical protein
MTLRIFFSKLGLVEMFPGTLDTYIKGNVTGDVKGIHHLDGVFVLEDGFLSLDGRALSLECTKDEIRLDHGFIVIHLTY